MTLFQRVSQWFGFCKPPVTIMPDTIESVTATIYKVLVEAGKEIATGGVLKERCLFLYVAPGDETLKQILKDGPIAVKVLPLLGNSYEQLRDAKNEVGPAPAEPIPCFSGNEGTFKTDENGTQWIE